MTNVFIVIKSQIRFFLALHAIAYATQRIRKIDESRSYKPCAITLAAGASWFINLVFFHRVTKRAILTFIKIVDNEIRHALIPPPIHLLVAACPHPAQ
jgi:hypothetical protein